VREEAEKKEYINIYLNGNNNVYYIIFIIFWKENGERKIRERENFYKVDILLFHNLLFRRRERERTLNFSGLFFD
jgi:hypothetical protein